MIDLHTHLLPNMDDGAQTTEEALGLTELLFQQGVHGAVCTPHFDPTLMPLEDFINRRAEAMSRMRSSKIPLIPASETNLHEYLLYYKSLEPLAIENTNYLLLELPFDKRWKEDIFIILDKLIIYYDIIPIIAHIERYPATRVRHIKRLKEMGCVIQLNTSSLLEKQHRRKALAYLKDGLIDLLGSDCHNLKNRPPQVQAAIELLRDRIGDPFCSVIIQRSDRVIRGFDIRRTNQTDMNIMY